ncbi:hypothetical protein OSTOST_16794, partial [Ostertagia ostertagi]
MRMEYKTEDNGRLNMYAYPLQDHTYSVQPVKLRCLHEISSLTMPSKSAENFDEFTSNTFGETLQAIFIRPYNEKVWTVSLSEMNCVWVENRVPRTCIEDLTRRCRLTRVELDHEDSAKTKSMFRYPRDCRGIGDVWKTIASELPSHWFHFDAPVIRIDTKAKM